jgi:anthranilate phosphoribosyltransferase
MELIIKTCKILWRKNVLVVRWEDWLDEVTLSWKTKVYELKDWIIKNYFITPEDFWFKICKSEEIFADEIWEKIEIAKKIIDFKEIGKYSDLVDLNVEVALKLMWK